MDLARSIVLPDEKHAHTHTVIFLHGRGDTAQDLAENLFLLKDSSKRSLNDAFPSVRWVFPQADLLYCERDDQDWSQWFDVWNTLDFMDREELQVPGLHDSVKNVIRLIRQEAQQVGGLDKIVLAGFSQGGATAMHAVLNLPPFRPNKSSKPQRLAGLMGFSCRLPFPGGTLEETREVLGLGGSPSDEILRNTPVFLAHCVDDPLVFVDYGRQLGHALATFGIQGISREYPEGGHQLNTPQGIDDIAIFLEAQGFPAGSTRDSI
ncbi:acyl-protein thioesterase [Xylariales sp. AK1849]|nr:acyl-protein thioesterase [Xylariales sp. AK1849]